MKLLLPALALAATLSPAEQLIFTKNFPGSTPAYFAISITAAGDLEYKEAPVDDRPLHAQLAPAETADLFQLAQKLDFFRTPLESGLHVAKTGEKTFRYLPDSAAPTQAVFNYSVNPSAQQLLDRFEQIGETERAYIELDRTVHFDKLGINDALAHIESLWLRKQLAGPQQFVPLLNRIANREIYMHLVRDRAARLRDEFTHSVPAVTAENRR